MMMEKVTQTADILNVYIEKKDIFEYTELSLFCTCYPFFVYIAIIIIINKIRYVIIFIFIFNTKHL